MANGGAVCPQEVSRVDVGVSVGVGVAVEELSHLPVVIFAIVLLIL
jgi:hypothetical protein